MQVVCKCHHYLVLAAVIERVTTLNMGYHAEERQRNEVVDVEQRCPLCQVTKLEAHCLETFAQLG
jgi:hypothetical protein